MQLSSAWERAKQVVAVLFALTIVAGLVYEIGYVDLPQPAPGTDAAFWEQHEFIGQSAAEVVAIAGVPSGLLSNSDTYCLDHAAGDACIEGQGPSLVVFFSADLTVVENVDVRGPGRPLLLQGVEPFTSQEWRRGAEGVRPELAGELVRSGRLLSVQRSAARELLGPSCLTSLSLRYTVPTGLGSATFISLVMDDMGVVLRRKTSSIEYESH